MALRSEKNIFRFNSFYNNGAGGIQCVGDSSPTDNYTPPSYNHIYNNVFYNNGYNTTDDDFTGGIYFASWGVIDPAGNVIKNNIFHLNSGGTITYDGTIEPQIISNNWDEEGDPMFVYDGGTITPSGDKPDFHLQSGSSCIDAGAYLTRIKSTSGSGTEFIVEDASYFTDGFNVIRGDSIQLYGTTDKAVITKIDYETNNITVDRTLSWSYNQGISLPYCGDSPDLGAYEFTGIQTGVEEEEENALPIEYNLSQNYPNPFNPETVIGYQIPKTASVTLIVYNILGQEVKRLVDDEKQPGYYLVKWDGTNASGVKVSSGVYIYRVKTRDGFVKMKTMMFLK